MDGLRGLALVAILFFHAGFAWAPGAFLSVSTFFTLSGFLITALVLEEHRRTDRVDVPGFFRRRLRRLLPASLLVTLGIVVASVIWADAAQISRLRGDVIAAMAQLANWRFIAVGDDYGDLFAAASPMQHFWSLAIEEQFYVAFPLVVLGSVVIARRSGRSLSRTLAVVFGGLAAASVVTGIVLTAQGAAFGRLYFGTDVRAAELLIGGLAAVWWFRRRHAGRPPARRPVTAVGATALVLTVVLWVTAERTDLWWYRGGLSLYALLTVAVVLAALESDGLVARALGWRPLVALGLISYGAYLIHWPVFVFLDGARTGLSPWPLFALRVSLSIALAVATYRWVERPVRSGNLSARAARWLGPAVAGCTVVLLLVATRGAEPTFDFEGAAERQDLSIAIWQQNVQEKPDGSVAIAFYGDSTGLQLGLGMAEWSASRPERSVEAGGAAGLGCALLEAPHRSADEGLIDYPEHCVDWADRWERHANAVRPDLAVVSVGPWEVFETIIDGEARLVGDAELDRLRAGALGEGVDRLVEEGARVVLLTSPEVEQGRVEGRSPPEPQPESDPLRMARFNEIIRSVAAERDEVELVDLGGYLDAHPQEREWRPDGVHLTTDAAGALAEEWLGERLVAVGAEE